MFLDNVRVSVRIGSAVGREVVDAGAVAVGGVPELEIMHQTIYTQTQVAHKLYHRGE